jgi:tellurite methyltransferase
MGQPVAFGSCAGSCGSAFPTDGRGARWVMAPSAPPESPISGFHQDGEGHWVADLACGHTQHVRHRPPQETRLWVTTEEGRLEHVGVALPCPFCRMPKLPAGATEYKRTAEFDEKTVPAGLTKTHTLKEGTWGELVVLDGHVLYVLEDQDGAAVVLRPGVNGTIAPCAPHHVEPKASARFFVRFLRIETPSRDR